MCDPIKTKEKNQRRRYTYVKSRERATTEVNMGTRVDIVWKEKRTITVRTGKRMDTPLKNVKERISLANSACSVIRRVTKKRSAGRNKNIRNKNKSRRLMTLKRYIMTSFSLGTMHLRAKINKINKEIMKMFVSDSGSTSHMVNSLKI